MSFVCHTTPSYTPQSRTLETPHSRTKHESLICLLANNLANLKDKTSISHCPKRSQILPAAGESFVTTPQRCFHWKTKHILLRARHFFPPPNRFYQGLWRTTVMGKFVSSAVFFSLSTIFANREHNKLSLLSISFAKYWFLLCTYSFIWNGELYSNCKLCIKFPIYTPRTASRFPIQIYGKNKIKLKCLTVHHKKRDQ